METIYLDYNPDRMSDWAKASKIIRCWPGTLAVEMLHAPEKIGSIYIPEQAQVTHYSGTQTQMMYDDEGRPVLQKVTDTEAPVAGFEPSVGVVLAVGEGVDVQPGEIVVCYDGDGLCLDESIGDYRPQNEVRFLGKVSPTLGKVEWLPWDESVMAVLFGENIKPTGQNIFVRVKSEKNDSSLILPDVAQSGRAIGVVIGAGPRSGVQEGDEIVYLLRGQKAFYKREGVVLIRSSAVMAVIQKEEVA